MDIDAATTARILRSYGINPPVTDKRFARHADLDVGISLTIDVTDDSYLGRSVRLRIGRRLSSGPCPMNESEAKTLVEEFRLAHLLPDVFKEDRTLVHLLVKCSQLYVESGLTRLHLACHLTPRGYRVNEAHMLSERALTAPLRLEPHAHDRKAVFPWRRTARVKKSPSPFK